MSQVVEYNQTEAALADLSERYKAILFDVSSVKGMDEAKQARSEIKKYRTSLEAKRVEIKSPALEHCRLIDAEAKRITAELVALENPIDEQIKAQEFKRDAEKREKERLEAEKLAAEAKAIKDAQDAELAAQQAEIARQQAELKAAQDAQAELERQSKLKIEQAEREARLRIEESERIARLAQEESDRKARAERDAEEAKAKKLRDEEESKLRAEREKIEEAQRVERKRLQDIADAEEAKKREEARLNAELQDGVGLLKTFITKYGKRKEFSAISSSISEFLKVKEAA